MKKILLCTTALVGLAASSAFASDWNVTTSGSAKFEAGARSVKKSDSQNLPLTANQNTAAFFSNSKVAINVTNKVDDMTYGATIRLQVATNQSNGTDRESRLDRSYIFMDSNFGSIQLGTNVAASMLLDVNAGTIASGTGGVDGDYTRFIGVTKSEANGNTAANQAHFTDLAITDVDTLSNRTDGNTESAEKITYLSPRVEGVQLGVSFTPDLSNGGNSITSATLYGSNPSYLFNNNKLRFKNIWSLALNYRNSFNDVNVELAATGNFGKSVAPRGTFVASGSTITSVNANGVQSNITTTQDFTSPANHNLKSYTLGAMLEKDGFSAVVSYANEGNSGAPMAGAVLTPNTATAPSNSVIASSNSFKSYWYTAGVAYENAGMSTSLTYLNGRRGNADDKLKTQAVSLGGGYEVMPGFKPFAEVTYVTYKPTGNAPVIEGRSNNTNVKATVFILGTRVKF